MIKIAKRDGTVEKFNKKRIYCLGNRKNYYEF